MYHEYDVEGNGKSDIQKRIKQGVISKIKEKGKLLKREGAGWVETNDKDSMQKVVEAFQNRQALLRAFSSDPNTTDESDTPVQLSVPSRPVDIRNIVNQLINDSVGEGIPFDTNLPLGHNRFRSEDAIHSTEPLVCVVTRWNVPNIQNYCFKILDPISRMTMTRK